MEKNDLLFWKAVIGGVVVMILIALVTVNILKFVPFVSPFIGGLAAGLIYGKGFLEGSKVGIVSGLLGAVAVGIDFMTRLGLLQGAVPQVPAFTGILFLVLALFYFPILSLIGGTIGGGIRH